MSEHFDPAHVSAASFDHPVEQLRLIETHISWVFLTGKYAYKIKKPVNLGFLDFSSLAKRQYFCDRELELNSLLVPQLYLDVVPIGGSSLQPRFGVSPAFEFAVKMHQFPQHVRFEVLLEAGQLQLEDMQRLGAYVATLHQQARHVDNTTGFGRIRSIASPIAMNYRALAQEPLSTAVRERLDRQCRQDFCDLRRLRKVLSQRAADGFIRDCHGDLHFGNLLRLDGQIIAFDRLEFDPALRWIDVMNEAAFPYMELIYHGRVDMAFEYLNAYTERTGDYMGLTVLPLYATYKALIRAKVSACDASLENDAREQGIITHLACAEQLSRKRTARLILTHGYSCSGKSWLAAKLINRLPAIRLRADIERKRQAGLAPLERGTAAPGTGLYDTTTTEATYRRLHTLATVVLEAGFDVIVDATFLAAWQRQLFIDTATKQEVGIMILDCQASREVLYERLRVRSTTAADPSDADERVLRWQLENAVPLTPAESALAVVVETDTEIDIAALVSTLRERN